MTFNKPAGVKYVDMAIYIDKHAYLTEGRDDEKIYEYLYHLFYVLAVKGRFFTSASDYDSYSLMAAGDVYKRLNNKKQFLPDDDPRKLPRIKSSLNYIKNVLYPLKVNYQKENYNEIIDENIENIDFDGLSRDIKKDLTGNSALFNKSDFRAYFKHIPNTIKKFISSLPYKDKIDSKNIYLSCLLTILNRVTWSNTSIDKLKFREERNLPLIKFIDNNYDSCRKVEPILYHLPTNMSTYIDVLVNKILCILKKDLKYLLHCNEPTSDIVKNMMKESVKNIMGDFESDD